MLKAEDTGRNSTEEETKRMDQRKNSLKSQFGILNFEFAFVLSKFSGPQRLESEDSGKNSKAQSKAESDD